MESLPGNGVEILSTMKYVGVLCSQGDTTRALQEGAILLAVVPSSYEDRNHGHAASFVIGWNKPQQQMSDWLRGLFTQPF